MSEPEFPPAAVDGNIHVMPVDEKEFHTESESCRCRPVWDPENKSDYLGDVADLKVFVHNRLGEARFS